MSGNKQGFECPKCKNNYSTAYSMYRHMRKVHNCDVNRCVTLYCPIEHCDQSYDRYNALDTHLTHAHYAEIRKETFNFSDLQDFETWLRDITLSSKTKYIKRSCNNSYRYYRCHRSGLPKTSTDKINTMKSSVKIGRHCPSRIIAKITDRSVQVEFVPTHIGHECEIAKIPLSQKKRQDIACRLAMNANNSLNTSSTLSESVAMQNNELNATTTSARPSTPTTTTTTTTTLTGHDRHLRGHPPSGDGPVTEELQANNSNLAAGEKSNNGPRGSSSSQATTSTIIQNDNPLLVSLESTAANPKSSSGTTAVNSLQDPQQTPAVTQQQQLADQISHQQVQLISRNQMAHQHGPSMNLVASSPHRQQLTNRFEQLMSSLRSEKHASIVKAQLEVCFALIQD